MHESLRLYDASLVILAEETEAIENEEEERLPELSQKRKALMEEAWAKRAGCPAPLLIEKLEVIRNAQNKLAAKATMQMETLRLSLKNSRKESTRLAGYGRTLGGGQNMSLLHKEG